LAQIVDSGDSAEADVVVHLTLSHSDTDLVSGLGIKEVPFGECLIRL